MKMMNSDPRRDMTKFHFNQMRLFCYLQTVNDNFGLWTLFQIIADFCCHQLYHCFSFLAEVGLWIIISDEGIRKWNHKDRLKCIWKNIIYTFSLSFPRIYSPLFYVRVCVGKIFLGNTRTIESAVIISTNQSNEELSLFQEWRDSNVCLVLIIKNHRWR